MLSSILQPSRRPELKSIDYRQIMTFQILIIQKQKQT